MLCVNCLLHTTHGWGELLLNPKLLIQVFQSLNAYSRKIQMSDCVDDWYDCLNDAFNHRLNIYIILSYIQAINEHDFE